LSLGNAYNIQENYDSSGHYFDQAISLAETLNIAHYKSIAYFSRGTTYSNSKAFDKALSYYKISERIAKKHGQFNLLRKIYLNRGGIDFFHKRYKNALPNFMNSIQIIEDSIFSKDLGDKSIQLAIKSGFDAYVGAIACAEKLGKKDLAFELIQKSKSRVLNDLLSRTINIEAIQKKLNDQQALVEYFWGDQLYVFIITRTSTNFIPLGKGEAIYNQLQKLKAAIVSISAKIKSKSLENKKYLFLTFDQSTNSLFKVLFEPILKEGVLNEKKELIIAPDHFLYTLPFELLTTKHDISDWEKNEYLANDYLIRYTQSASIFYQEKKRIKKKLDEAPSMLVIAKSKFPNYNELDSLSLFRKRPLARMYGEQCVFLEEEQATLKNIKTMQLDQYNNLYIYSHAVINDSIPELSYIALNDSRLSLYQFDDPQLKLNNDIIVLAACETARGKFQRGNGVMGFTRGLMNLGAKTMIISLWPVEDQATGLLFEDFWGQIHQGVRPLEALRQARLYLGEVKPEYKHPFYWSAFVGFGDL